MRCYFLRHGIAAEADEFIGSDFDRPLTAEGRKLMRREAKAMAALSLELEIIITSPLVRAKQTAEIVAKEVVVREGVVEDLRAGLDFSPALALAILRDHANAKKIMFVGHEPTMSRTIGEFIGDADVEMKKGSLACIDLPNADASHGFLVFLVPPKVLVLSAP